MFAAPSGASQSRRVPAGAIRILTTEHEDAAGEQGRGHGALPPSTCQKKCCDLGRKDQNRSPARSRAVRHQPAEEGSKRRPNTQGAPHGHVPVPSPTIRRRFPRAQLSPRGPGVAPRPGGWPGTPRPQAGRGGGHVHAASATGHATQPPQPPPATAAQGRFPSLWRLRGPRQDLLLPPLPRPFPLPPRPRLARSPLPPQHPRAVSQHLLPPSSSSSLPRRSSSRLVAAPAQSHPHPLPRTRSRPQRRGRPARRTCSLPRAGPGCPSWLCFAAPSRPQW